MGGHACVSRRAAEPIDNLGNPSPCPQVVCDKYRLLESLEGQLVIDHIGVQANLSLFEVKLREFLDFLKTCPQRRRTFVFVVRIKSQPFGADEVRGRRIGTGDEELHRFAKEVHQPDFKENIAEGFRRRLVGINRDAKAAATNEIDNLAEEISGSGNFRRGDGGEAQFREHPANRIHHLPLDSGDGFASVQHEKGVSRERLVRAVKLGAIDRRENDCHLFLPDSFVWTLGFLLVDDAAGSGVQLNPPIGAWIVDLHAILDGTDTMSFACVFPHGAAALSVQSGKNSRTWHGEQFKRLAHVTSACEAPRNSAEARGVTGAGR